MVYPKFILSNQNPLVYTGVKELPLWLPSRIIISVLAWDSGHTKICFNLTIMVYEDMSFEDSTTAFLDIGIEFF